MLRKTIAIALLIFPCTIFCQDKLLKLSVEKIMRDPKWMGTSPSNPYWSQDGKYLLFNWNPENAEADSIYVITPANINPVKTNLSFRNNIIRYNSIQFNSNRSAFVYTDEGDIFLGDVKTGRQKRITKTNEAELNPQFAFNDSRVVYTNNYKLYTWA